VGAGLLTPRSQTEACEAKDLYLPQKAAGREKYQGGGGNYRVLGKLDAESEMAF
jgi:hypothetical protein